MDPLRPYVYIISLPQIMGTQSFCLVEMNVMEIMLMIYFVLLQVANTLNMKFKASCGRQLTEENLKFLAGKAFRWVWRYLDIEMSFEGMKVGFEEI